MYKKECKKADKLQGPSEKVAAKEVLLLNPLKGSRSGGAGHSVLRELGVACILRK